MPTGRRTPVWEPPATIRALFGDVSGNDINGLGRAEATAPHVIMWAHPDTIEHGAVQVHMTQEFVAHPELSTVLRVDDRHTPAEIAERGSERSAAGWADAVRRRALRDAAVPVELLGVTPARDEWFYEGRTSDLPNVIVLGVAMDHAALATAPEHTSAMEVHRQYNRGTAAARDLADWIRGHGFEAEGHGGPGAGPLLMIPAALACGFGELGKHGSIINRELGSSFRLAAVLTDMPLTADAPDTFGADDFCWGCRVCADACPPAAIAHDVQLVRGVEKWYVDFDACMPYFAASYGCGICIAVCPWSTPGEAPRLAENMTRKMQRRSPGS